MPTSKSKFLKLYERDWDGCLDFFWLENSVFFDNLEYEKFSIYVGLWL